MVTIRLTRRGGKKTPFYHVVVTDSRKRQGGTSLESVGLFNPVARGAEVKLRLNVARIEHWLKQGRPHVRPRQVSADQLPQTGRVRAGKAAEGSDERRVIGAHRTGVRGRAIWRPRLGQATFAHRSAGALARASKLAASAAGGVWRTYRDRGERPQRRRADGEVGGSRGSGSGAGACGVQQVCVPRSELPQRDAKDFYRADLIGCEVVNLAGVGLGVVQHFVETPAQALMVVRGDAGILGAGRAAASAASGFAGAPGGRGLGRRTARAPRLGAHAYCGGVAVSA